MTGSRSRRAAAVWLAALVLLATGCSGGDGGGYDDVPADSALRAAVAPYLAAAKVELVSMMVEDGHLGVYVRPVPAWSLDEYVAALPQAAEHARSLLTQFPQLGDVDVCADAPWLPHPSGTAFVPGSRVQVFRDRVTKLPPAFREPVDVLEAALDDRSMDYFVDTKIIDDAELYAETLRALSKRRKGTG